MLVGMETIRLEQQNKTAIVTLARPERRNALSLMMMRELTGCLREIGTGRDARSVILAADGKVFSSGHDLSEMRSRTLGDYREIFDACCELMETVQSIPQPVIAEVQGLATAAGCQLVASCDLAVAGQSAGFATPGVKIGLFCTTPMVAVTRAIGRKRAMEMLLTGRIVSAAEAAEWGLVNRVVSDSELRAVTLELATQVGTASPLIVTLGKEAFYTQIDLDQPKAYAYAKEIMSMNALASDAQEGFTAFLEKRPPCWTGE
jgi:enoyl-CoA hydratase/carnithine racemase